MDIESVRKRVRSGGVGEATKPHARVHTHARVSLPGCPPWDTPLQAFRPTPTRIEHRKAVDAVVASGLHAVLWCLGRAEDYFRGPGRQWPYEIHDHAAAIDYLRYAKPHTR